MKKRKRTNKEEWVHRAGKRGTDEERKGNSGGATEEEEGSEDSRLAAPPPTVLGEGDTPPSPHQNLISTLTHIHWSSTFNKTVPGRELLTWGKTRSGFHHLPISSITARAIPSPDGPKQQSLNFLAPQTRGQFFHGPEGGGRVVWRWFKCITSIIISVPLQTIRH